ncbi:MAG: urease accessory protein UreD [Polyangiales bacterium]
MHGESHTGWRAELRLSFVRDAARTALFERSHHGPLRVQRPFYPEGPGVCHLYVLHPPGGLVAGDQLQLRASVQPEAHALITTPAAAKLYRTHHQDRLAQQDNVLDVARGASLEWLPQETIAFSGARAALSTRVTLAADARFVGWEILCLGRPVAGERFVAGEVRPSFELSRAGVCTYVERGRYTAGTPLMDAPWGLAGQPVVGTMVCAVPGAAQHVEAARALLAGELGHTGELASAEESPVGWPPAAAVSGWDDLLIARYLGPSGEQARTLFATLWAALRPALLGRPACPPRIWHT